MRLRFLFVTIVLLMTASALACSSSSGDTTGMIKQARLFAGSVWAAGVLLTLGFGLLKGPDKRGLALPAVSCLGALMVFLSDKGTSGDCGSTISSSMALWFFGQLALVAWGMRRRRRG
ncbi:MAG: hypothetical protein ACO1SV_05495 [Fimbriimonas sp.]